MIICVIILIIFAALADNREEEIDNRIIETERTNESIQNELVNLKEENYKLTKEKETNDETINEYNEYLEDLSSMTEAWNLIVSNDLEGASKILRNMDISGFDENKTAYFGALCKLAGIE